MTAGASGAPAASVLAGSERRFYAFALDRLLAWGAYAAAAATLALTLFRHGSMLPGMVMLAAVVLLVWLLGALLTGLLGATPGKRALGLKVVRAVDGRPIGLSAALLRQGALGVLTLPTAGMGTAALAWTATATPTAQRRGLHDRLAGSLVIDVRRPPAPAADDMAGMADTGAPPAPPLVNLTAMRLRPVTQAAAAPTYSPRRHAPQTEGEVPESRVPHTEVSPGRWLVAFDNGESFPVAGLALVGRRPEPRRGDPVTHLVTLVSADGSLSRTHAQFQVTPAGDLVVMDCGSAYGTTLIRDGASRLLAGRHPTTLLDGDRVRFGDRVMLVRREA